MTVSGRLYTAAVIVAVATVPVASILSQPKYDATGCPQIGPCDPHLQYNDWLGFVVGFGLAVLLVLLGLFLARRARARVGGGAHGGS